MLTITFNHKINNNYTNISATMIQCANACRCVPTIQECAERVEKFATTQYEEQDVCLMLDTYKGITYDYALDFIRECGLTYYEKPEYKGVTTLVIRKKNR